MQSESTLTMLTCRVVTVSDLAAHLPLPMGAAAASAAAAAGGGGWKPWSGHDPVTALAGPEAAMHRRNVLLGLLAEVCILCYAVLHQRRIVVILCTS